MSRREYNNIKNQLDATITVFINNPNQVDMFRAMISPAGSIVGALYHKL